MRVELWAGRCSGVKRGVGVELRVDSGREGRNERRILSGFGRKGRNERSILGREGSVRSGSGKKWRNERRILGGERCG